VLINNSNNSLELTTTSVVSSLNPSSYGQTVTFTATVAPAVSGIPTGTVTFYDGATLLGESSLSSNAVATFSTSTLAEGTHSISATYFGDTQFVPSKSSLVSQVVNGAVGRLVKTLLAFAPQVVGTTSSTLNETLNNDGDEQMTVTGVTTTGDFSVQSNYCMSGVKPGTHCNVYVVFNPTQTGPRTGTLTFTDDATNSPQTAKLTGTGLYATTTGVVSSPNPSNFNQAVTFTATVAPEGVGTPTGTVTFLDGTKILGSSLLNSSGVATFTTSTLAVGTYSITSTYNGDSNFASSTSAVLSQVVQGTVAVTLSTTSLSFGNQAVNTTSAAKTVTLTNTGTATLDISSITFTGADPSDFAQTNTCGTTVAAKGKCTISVKFTPQATGTRTATLNVKDTANNSPQTVKLTGTGE
jgi:hypothetical protein